MRFIEYSEERIATTGLMGRDGFSSRPESSKENARLLFTQFENILQRPPFNAASILTFVLPLEVSDCFDDSDRDDGAGESRQLVQMVNQNRARRAGKDSYVKCDDVRFVKPGEIAGKFVAFHQKLAQHNPGFELNEILKKMNEYADHIILNCLEGQQFPGQTSKPNFEISVRLKPSGDWIETGQNLMNTQDCFFIGDLPFADLYIPKFPIPLKLVQRMEKGQNDSYKVPGLSLPKSMWSFRTILNYLGHAEASLEEQQVHEQKVNKDFRFSYIVQKEDRSFILTLLKSEDEAGAHDPLEEESSEKAIQGIEARVAYQLRFTPAWREGLFREGVTGGKEVEPHTVKDSKKMSPPPPPVSRPVPPVSTKPPGAIALTHRMIPYEKKGDYSWFLGKQGDFVESPESAVVELKVSTTKGNVTVKPKKSHITLFEVNPKLQEPPSFPKPVDENLSFTVNELNSGRQLIFHYPQIDFKFILGDSFGWIAGNGKVEPGAPKNFMTVVDTEPDYPKAVEGGKCYMFGRDPACGAFKLFDSDNEEYDKEGAGRQFSSGFHGLYNSNTNVFYNLSAYFPVVILRQDGTRKVLKPLHLDQQRSNLIKESGRKGADQLFSFIAPFETQIHRASLMSGDRLFIGSGIFTCLKDKPIQKQEETPPEPENPVDVSEPSEKEKPTEATGPPPVDTVPTPIKNATPPVSDIPAHTKKKVVEKNLESEQAKFQNAVYCLKPEHVYFTAEKDQVVIGNHTQCDMLIPSSGGQKTRELTISTNLAGAQQPQNYPWVAGLTLPVFTSEGQEAFVQLNYDENPTLLYLIGVPLMSTMETVHLHGGASLKLRTNANGNIIFKDINGIDPAVIGISTDGGGKWTSYSEDPYAFFIHDDALIRLGHILYRICRVP